MEVTGESLVDGQKLDAMQSPPAVREATTPAELVARAIAPVKREFLQPSVDSGNDENVLERLKRNVEEEIQREMKLRSLEGWMALPAPPTCTRQKSVAAAAGVQKKTESSDFLWINTALRIGIPSLSLRTLKVVQRRGKKGFFIPPRFGKRKLHNFISSKNGNGEITMSNSLTKPSTDEEAADTFNSDLCKEIKDGVTTMNELSGYGESSAGPQKFRVINSESEEPDESMQKNVQFIDFLGVGT
ncbi:hypothetical protein EJ110_NYTH25965 [Nymphaea thermarum]|nr:hypothetical protein EJ110_NYTH25965 [Nymphaea thermarum]